MGRKPHSRNHTRKKEDLRHRHRNADCKYRSKVQYLYFKIKSLLKMKTPKDGLFNKALIFIQDLEKKICQTRGAEYFDVCKKEFYNFIVEEEALWKKEKDMNKWWKKVEDLLIKNQALSQKSTTVIKIEDIDESCNQPIKPSKRPYRRRLIRSKNQNNINLNNGKCYCVKNTLYDDFQNVYNIKEEKSLSSPKWNAPEVVYSSPFVPKDSEGIIPSEEIKMNNSINLRSSNVFNTTEIAKDVSSTPVPVQNENIMFDTSRGTKSFLLYL